MKFKKSNDTENMMVRLEMRNIFHQGRSMPLYWEYEHIESFTATYHFGCKPFNRKRDTYSYYKDMFRSDYNDGIYWNGEEE